ncbi:MAG: hypothetical protein ACKVS6_15340 [Planctomycetota bacterium]
MGHIAWNITIAFLPILAQPVHPAVHRQAESAPANSELLQKWNDCLKRSAKEHVAIAQYCVQKNLFRQASLDFSRARGLDRENADVKIGIGEREARDEGNVDYKMAQIKIVDAKRSACVPKIINEMLAFAKAAEKLKDSALTGRAYGMILDYNPNHEIANKALGRKKENNIWVHPRVAATKTALQERIKNAKIETDLAPHAFEKRSGLKFQKLKSANYQFFGTIEPAPLRELICAAEASLCQIASSLQIKLPLAQAPVIGVFLAKEEEHAAFVDACSSGDKEHYKKFTTSWVIQPRAFETCAEFRYAIEISLHHGVVHDLLEFLAKGEPPAWIVEGTGYWIMRYFSDIFFLSCATLPLAVPVAVRPNENAGAWMNTIRANVRDGVDGTVAEILTTKFRTPELMRKIWSFVDYLITKRPEGFVSYLRDGHYKKDPVNGLAVACGVANLETLDQEWRDFVREYY